MIYLNRVKSFKYELVFRFFRLFLNGNCIKFLKWWLIIKVIIFLMSNFFLLKRDFILKKFKFKKKRLGFRIKRVIFFYRFNLIKYLILLFYI